MDENQSEEKGIKESIKISKRIIRSKEDPIINLQLLIKEVNEIVKTEDKKNNENKEVKQHSVKDKFGWYIM